jgi:dUTP pyrophosphatase
MTVEAGVIDEDYRGEIIVLLRSREAMELKRGWKIAQMIITPYVTPEIIQVDELGETERGSGGFGSTGK